MNVKGLLGALIAAQVQKAISGRSGASSGGAGAGGGGLLGGLSRSLGGSAGTALAGALGGMVFGSKKGRSLGGSLGKLGGLAVVGSLAWNAYQEWQAKQAQQGQPAQPGARPTGFLDTAASAFGGAPTQGAQPPQGSPLAPASEADEEELSRVLVRAMIAAAKSDGHIDAAETAALGTELGKLPLDEDDRAFILDEMRAPLDVARVARGAQNPEIASAVYAASLLAITVDTEAERTYLATLARELKLDPSLVATLHEKVDAAAPVG